MRSLSRLSQVGYLNYSERQILTRDSNPQTSYDGESGDQQWSPVHVEGVVEHAGTRARL